MKVAVPSAVDETEMREQDVGPHGHHRDREFQLRAFASRQSGKLVHASGRDQQHQERERRRPGDAGKADDREEQPDQDAARANGGLGR